MNIWEKATGQYNWKLSLSHSSHHDYVKQKDYGFQILLIIATWFTFRRKFAVCLSIAAFSIHGV